MAAIAEQLAELTRLFLRVALQDPISFVLFLLGALVTGFSVLVLGYLGGGAVVDLFTPEPGGGPPRRG